MTYRLAGTTPYVLRVCSRHDSGHLLPLCLPEPEGELPCSFHIEFLEFGQRRWLGVRAVLGDVSPEEQHLRIENARLKDELDRVYTLTGKFLSRPISSGSSMSVLQGCSGLELGIGTNGGFWLGPLGASALQPLPDLMGAGGLPGPVGSTAAMCLPVGISTLDGAMHGAADGIDHTVLLELGLAAMEELMKVAQMDEPLWLRSPDGGGGLETLNFDEYHWAFARVFVPSPAGYVSEATREASIAITSSVDLVDSLMDTMHAELQVLSPQVPIREVLFLWFCKQHAEGPWAVVDVSVDAILHPDGGNHHSHHHHAQNGGGAAGYMVCRLLPTGCIVQDMNNGYSKLVATRCTLELKYDFTLPWNE
ncbi:homeobox-leucine zipper protein ROC6-like [Miscanthus floridulus]|uniref:homeobox-leucine zipper protein ROC6-like n=1 Tax=Miscanthus floridulus TaxID=154761 RepID=UPI00345A485C